MTDIKTKYRGGDRASKPTSGATHPMQRPGMAGKAPAKMSWTGHEHKK